MKGKSKSQVSLKFIEPGAPLPLQLWPHIVDWQIEHVPKQQEASLNNLIFGLEPYLVLTTYM